MSFCLMFLSVLSLDLLLLVIHNGLVILNYMIPIRTKEEGIPSGTTTIINQGASNHLPGRPPANLLSYYAYIAPRQPGYQLVSSSSQEL